MAYTPCSQNVVSQNIATDCNVQRVKGYEPLGLGIRRDDIDFALSTVDASNPRLIGDIKLLAGKKTFVIYNDKNNPLPFDGTQTVYNRDENQYDKTVQFYYEGIGAESSKTVVEGLKDDNYVIILPRKDHNGKGAFQVFGWQHGLSCGNEGGAQVQDETTGYWLMTMTCREKFAGFELTDSASYIDSKALFDALKALSY